MISAAALQASEAFRVQFETAKPFRHVVIDDFLEPPACEALLRDFPAFNEKYAADEHGGVGRKAVVERAASISPFYRSFHDYINSTPFLSAMSALTGIDDLISDPTLFGGGTHENLAGQGLNVHVDFNIDERRMLHRRVNLLIYLNKEWDEAWGGAIELHSDPFNPLVDEWKSYLPLFNRAVLFETNEYSWHGFQRIVLPPVKTHLSRKSFSVYLYTKDRPPEEVVAPHTTFYVPEPLPEHIKAGRTLTDDDMRDIAIRMQGRDGLLRMYQKLLIEKEQRLRDFLQVAQRSPDHQAILSSRSWKLVMALQRLKYRLTHL
ncbi:MAG TPA: 2OG-Fe(II) oxygenase, partial [Casimicrobiaceae bacterium]|nr:2OG-Fe(II) oxygenase [Casimicrobiaceae bacterium]